MDAGGMGQATEHDCAANMTLILEKKMRDHSLHVELSRQEAVAEMTDALSASSGKIRPERVALEDAYGRVLSRDITCKSDVPSALTCALDSIAVKWDDFADLEPGAVPDTSSWVRGIDWEFANTGVAMPEGFDTAIVIEHVEVSDDEERVTILAAPSERFAGTRAAGSKMKASDIAVAAPCIITPDVAARIASAGHSSVEVMARPRVAFIPTGNELVSPNVPFSKRAPDRFAGAGRAYESNSIVVKGKVEQWGGVYVPFDIVPDDRDAIQTAVERACAVADIVVLNAGSSKGSDDWSVEVLEEMGRIICHQTNHGPGHHSSYAIVGDTPIVGISGPSAGASFTLNFYLLPIMRKFQGLDPNPTLVPARLGAEFPKGKMHKRAEEDGRPLSGEERPAEATRPGEEFFSIKFLELAPDADGCLVATPLPGRPGSPQTYGANALYMLPAGASATMPSPGDIIMVEPLM